MKTKFKLSIRAILSIAIIIVAIMLISSYIEFRQSKEEIYHLLHEHSSSLLETVIKSSSNTLNSSYEIENILAEKLLDNARLINSLDEHNLLNKDLLIKLGKENNLFRINVFDTKGNRVLTNRVPEPGHLHDEGEINRYDELSDLFRNGKEELIIGLKKARFTDGERFAVAVARSNNKGAIVVNIDATTFLNFRKTIGIGAILQELSKHDQIEYIILQDTIGILAASEVIDSTEAISESEILLSALSTNSIYSRIIDYNGSDIYEVTKRFVYEDEVIGLFRLGVKLDDVKAVENRMSVRLIIISLILAAISIIVLSIVFTTQNLKSISKEYNNFKTFTSTVLENMSEAVIVYDEQFSIILINKSAISLFKTDYNIKGQNIHTINNGILSFLNKETLQDKEFKIMINNEELFLLFSTNKIEEENKHIFIAVIKNITNQRRFEEEAKKNEKLSAMGGLASGVAHEIRNPINAIGMIAQRLNKEFHNVDNQEEFLVITKLLRDEVNRINKIITQFLNYAKPLELNLTEVNVKKLFDDIFNLYNGTAKQKSIIFKVSGEVDLAFKLDLDLIKQALLNIIQNAFDASKNSGTIIVEYYLHNNELVIEVKDNGCGIPSENLNKIFDLYYTTKNDGNGLGLSISQKIISQHSGSISISSLKDQGTTFKIILPRL